MLFDRNHDHEKVTLHVKKKLSNREVVRLQ